MNWKWVNRNTVFAVHDKQLAIHGSQDGMPDLNAGESALHRAQILDAYGKPGPDTGDLAAAYIFGIAISHGFNDGNKRTTWVVGRLFVAINDQKLAFDQLNAIYFMRAVAAGNMTQLHIAQWIRQRLAQSLP